MIDAIILGLGFTIGLTAAVIAVFAVTLLLILFVALLVGK